MLEASTFKLPKYVWIIVAAVAIAETLFWVPMLQIDSMWWSIPDGWQDWMWIPAFGLTYRHCFITFFNIAVVAMHIPILVIIWLVAEKLRYTLQITKEA